MMKDTKYVPVPVMLSDSKMYNGQLLRRLCLGNLWAKLQIIFFHLIFRIGNWIVNVEKLLLHLLCLPQFMK